MSNNQKTKPDDISRDEWIVACGLAAIATARAPRDPDGRPYLSDISEAVQEFGWHYAAYDGAHSEKYGDNKYNDSDHSDPDMYAAGAALYEALTP